VRTVVVLSGTLYFGSGDKWDESKFKAYPADGVASPDERFHQCIYYPAASELDPYPAVTSKPKTRCFFAPMNSS